MSQSSEDIQEEIQELLKCQDLLEDIDLETIIKEPSCVDYSTIKSSPIIQDTGPISVEAAELLAKVQDEIDFESKYPQETALNGLGPPPKAITLLDFQATDWCCICDQDASLYCPGCDNEKYCSDCFRKGHSQGEFSKHIAIKI